MLETDEEVGREAGQFPEDEEGDEIAGQHQPEHRRHEEAEKEIEAPHIPVSGQITSGIDEDQRPDSSHQQRKDQAQAVEIEGERNPRRRQPRQGLKNRPASGDFVHLAKIVNRQHQRHEGEKPAGASGSQTGHGRGDEGQKKNEKYRP